MIRTLRLIGCAALVVSIACAAQAPNPNSLSDAERAAGWRLLFDGTTTAGWRGYHMDSLPSGWRVVDGALTRGGSGGDIITKDTFANFELDLEGRIAPRGNAPLEVELGVGEGGLDMQNTRLNSSHRC